MKLEGRVAVAEFDPFATQTSGGSHALGEIIWLGDGRAFRYAKAGASNISAGKLSVAPTPKTNHHSCTAIVSAVGTLTPTFTLGATAAVASEYNEGYISINVTPDVGRTYKISNMAAVASAGTANPTLFEGLRTAWTTATRVSLIHNPWNNCIEGTSQTKRGAGVPLTAVTAADNCWLQTKGVAATLADQTIALGSCCVPSTSVAGSIIAQSSTFATAQVTTTVAIADVMAGVDQEYRPVTLCID